MTCSRVSVAVVCAALVLPAAGQTALYTILGSAQNDSLGFSVANCGDVDLDGVADLAVGTPGEFAGAVRVYSGATGALLHLFQHPGATEVLYGSSVGAAGDVDGDGRADVLVGAQGNIGGLALPSFVEVRSGANGAVLRTLNGPLGSRFGASLEPLGDWNGDGRQEFIVGAQNAASNGQDSGRAYVFDGDPSVATPLYTYDGSAPNEYYASDVGAAGDIDGDGVGDFAIGNPIHPVAAQFRFGRVRLFSGATGALLRDLLGPNSVNGPSGFGTSLANVGDINGDGRSDMLVGAPYCRNAPLPTTSLGLARVHSGLDGAVLYEVVGEENDDQLGNFVGAVGDIDGDAAPDFQIAVHGAAYTSIVSGRTLDAVFAISGGTFSYIGYAACALGDVNGDGLGDFAISSPGFSNARGRVVVYAGNGSSVLAYCTPGVTSNGCVPALSPNGVPSASAASPFTVSASGLEGGKPGLFFYGVNGANASPWGSSSSLLCVKAPLQRTKFSFPSGTSGQCDGVLGFDWNQYVAGNPDALGAPFQTGDRVWLQGWFRDPGSTKVTSLTGALTFELAP
ncbi:MAG: VCBS repeat-containing protein [Planctomycetes bacterium]|nr:VCBS repeat-containing protein [Planctomycetota bacterium]